MALRAELFILGLLLSPTPVSAGPGAVFCVPACHTAYFACIAGAIGVTAGTVILACIAACTACDLACVGATCHDASNLVTTKNGPIPVAEVKPGDLIATLSDAEEIVYTRVVKNAQLKTDAAAFGFRHVRLANGQAFNVTNEHILVTERPGGILQIERAHNILVGDVMVTDMGARSSVSFTHSFHLPEKWTLGTEDGTALVNGVLMTTMCDDSFPQLSKRYKTAMSVWRTEHRHLLLEDTVSNDATKFTMHGQSSHRDKRNDEGNEGISEVVPV